EADSYMRWRDTYQQNWSNYFDPIAVRLEVSQTLMAADLTVMPLIVATEYRSMIDVSRGAKLHAGAGDPHDDMLHLALAIDPKSVPMTEMSQMIRQYVLPKAEDPLGWVGAAVAVYVEDDPVWQEAAKAESRDAFWTKRGV